MKISRNAVWARLIATLVVILFWGCASTSQKTETSATESVSVQSAAAVAPIVSVAQDGDGRLLHMTFDQGNHTAKIQYEGQTIDLVGQRMASGIRYTNDEYELLGKGSLVELRKGDVLLFRGESIHQSEGGAAGEVEVADLKDTAWKLLSYLSPDGEMVAPLPGPAVTLRITDERASGFTGCNNYFGPYQLKGDQLTFGPLASTRMAGSDAQNRQESIFLGLLSEVRHFHVVDEQLQLCNEDGKVLFIFAEESGD